MEDTEGLIQRPYGGTQERAFLKGFRPQGEHSENHGFKLTALAADHQGPVLTPSTTSWVTSSRPLCPCCSPGLQRAIL